MTLRGPAATMTDSPHLAPLVHAGAGPLLAAAPIASPDVAATRLRILVEQNYDYVWRTLRHLGFAAAAAEDGAQEVMCVVARHLGKIEPGRERSFMYSAALRVAGTLRRTARRRPESTGASLEALASAAPSAEELLDERRKLEALQRVLDAMPF